MRNAQSKVSKTDLLWLLPLIKDLVGSRTKESFELAWKELNRVAQSKGKDNLLDWLDSTYHEISVYLDFPAAHWSRIKCTNSLERLNEELRRRGEELPAVVWRNLARLFRGLDQRKTISFRPYGEDQRNHEKAYTI